jgi:hypothetical protein
MVSNLIVCVWELVSQFVCCSKLQDTDDMDYLLPQSVTELGNCLFQLLATLVRDLMPCHGPALGRVASTCPSPSCVCAAWPLLRDSCS